ncbi:MAG: hypothetical protein AABX01_01755 [Candidatus Micrarchaeota archaeon]
MAYSTISVSPKIKRRLEGFRLYRRETYDELLGRLMEDASLGDDEGEFTQEAKEGIKRGLKDIKEGRTIPLEKIIGKYGIDAG